MNIVDSVTEMMSKRDVDGIAATNEAPRGKSDTPEAHCIKHSDPCLVEQTSFNINVPSSLCENEAREKAQQTTVERSGATKEPPRTGSSSETLLTVGTVVDNSSAGGVPSDSTPGMELDDAKKKKIQLEIQAQAELVRRSFTSSVRRTSSSAATIAAAASMASANKRRRQTYASSHDSEESFVSERSQRVLSHPFQPSAQWALRSARSQANQRNSGGLAEESSSSMNQSNSLDLGSPTMNNGVFDSIRSRGEIHTEIPLRQRESSTPAQAFSSSSTPGSGLDSTASFTSASSITLRNHNHATLESHLSSMQSQPLNRTTLNPPLSFNVTKNDVVFGDGRVTNTLVGNRRYRVLLNLHSQAFKKADSYYEKLAIARSVVQAVRQNSPSGRFIELDVTSGLWRHIGDEMATNSTLKELFERNPSAQSAVLAARSGKEGNRRQCSGATPKAA